MALVKCKECGKDVSDKAKTCPNCGADIRMQQLSTIQKIGYLLLFVIIVSAVVMLFNMLFMDEFIERFHRYFL